MSNRNSIQMLWNKISNLIDEKLDNFKADKTFKSTIWKVNEDGTYQISYLGQLYNVPSYVGVLYLGQTVQVKIPCGILKNMYIDGALGINSGNEEDSPLIEYKSVEDIIKVSTVGVLEDSVSGGLKINKIYGEEIPLKKISGVQLLNYEAWRQNSTGRGSAVYENFGVTLTATDDDCYTNFNITNFPTYARISVTAGNSITMSWETEGDALGKVYIFGFNNTSAGTGYTTLASVESTEQQLTYTVPSGVNYITFRFGVQYAGDTISYKNIMINKGDIALSWEPYTSGKQYNQACYPESKIEDVVISEIKTVGAQLFKLSSSITADAKTYNIDVRENEFGNIVLDSKSQNNDCILQNDISITLGTCELKKDDTVTLTSNSALRLVVYNNTTSSELIVKEVAEHSITFIAPDSGTYSIILSNYKGNKLTHCFANIMINKGYSALSWQKYEESSATLSEPITLRSLPNSSINEDFRDFIDVERGVHVQKVGVRTIKKTDNYEFVTNGIGMSNFADDVLQSSNACTPCRSNIRPWFANGSMWDYNSLGIDGTYFWYEDKGHLLYPTQIWYWGKANYTMLDINNNTINKVILPDAGYEYPIFLVLTTSKYGEFTGSSYQFYCYVSTADYSNIFSVTQNVRMVYLRQEIYDAETGVYLKTIYDSTITMFATSSFSGVCLDGSTDFPIFSSREAAVEYFRYGDKSGMLNDVEIRMSKNTFGDIPITVYYPLATPIETPLPEEDATALRNLKTCETTTYITTDSNIEPCYDLEYGTVDVGGYALERQSTYIVVDGDSGSSGDSEGDSGDSGDSVPVTIAGTLKPWLYDTSGKETVIGVYNGKPLYRKIIEFGAMPNATNKELAHGIANVEEIWISGGYAKSGERIYTLSYVNPDNLSTSWNFWATTTNIGCYTKYNRSNFIAYVTVNYTKTTDASGSGNGLAPYIRIDMVGDTNIPIYLGGQTFFDNITCSSTSRTNFYIMYKSRADKLFEFPFEIPEGYSIKYRLSASIWTKSNTELILGINGTPLLSALTWSDSNFKYQVFSELFSFEDITDEYAYAHSTNLLAYNFYVMNKGTGSSYVNDITIHGYLVCDNAAKTSSSTTYSLKEQCIGTWIDGKPLYQKTLFYENHTLQKGLNYLDFNIDIEMLADVKAYQTNSTHTNIRPINTYNFDEQSSTNSLYYTVELDSKRIGLYANTVWSSPNIYFTFQYTKTTD